MKVASGFSRGRLIIPPVRMRHKYLREPVMALDTGARVSAIKPELAAALGFEPGEMEPVRTASLAVAPRSLC